MIEKKENYDSERVLAEVVNKALAESRLKKWMTFMVAILFISFMIVRMMDAKQVSVDDFKGHVSMVSIEGPIGPGTKNEAHTKIALIEKAFEEQNSKSVILKLNSGGGSPAHAKVIYDRINSLKKEHKKKVYASIEDSCASACYYIASAADEVLVTPMSIVGSIGVKMESWDFTEAMDKVGVKSDTLASGKNKVMISPFVKKDPESVKYIEDEVLRALHDTFIEDVKLGRKGLSEVDKGDDRFSGMIYAGKKAIEIGLADRAGDIYSILEEEKVAHKDFELTIKSLEPAENILQKLFMKAAAEEAVGMFKETVAR